ADTPGGLRPALTPAPGRRASPHGNQPRSPASSPAETPDQPFDTEPLLQGCRSRAASFGADGPAGEGCAVRVPICAPFATASAAGDESCTWSESELVRPSPGRGEHGQAHGDRASNAG